VEYAVGRGVRFDAGEVTGALGDAVTVVPIVVALGALTEASLPHVLLAFGAFQVVWGVVYGLPISVEPMKALAGLAIAGAIGYGELVAAGLVTGAVLLAAGRTGLLSRLAAAIEEPVVRGVQLAVALLLARAGIGLAVPDPGPAAAATVAVVLVGAVASRGAAALVVLGGGAAVAVGGGPVEPTLSSLAALPTPAPTLSAGALSAAAAQVAMTVGNAAVATSLLCSDLYDAEVSPDRLANSMGVTCLAAVPLGGLPMCHGSGGLAGKHAFGARTGGANVVLGGLYALAAAFAGVVARFPTAVLGVLLVVVAVELGRTAVRSERRWLVALVGVAGLLWNVGGAFLLGAVAGAVVRRVGAGR